MQSASKRAPAMERTRYPGVFRRGDRYVVVWRHLGRQRKETFRTLAEARAAKGAREAGDTLPPQRMSFADYAREWTVTYRGRTDRGLSVSTRRDYIRTLEGYAIPFFAGRRLDQIRPRDVRAYVHMLEQRGQLPSTIRKNLAPVRALFATAVEDELVAVNPTAVIRIPAGRDGEGEASRRALSHAELARFLAEVPAEWRLFFEFLLHTGVRIGEALGLMWADVEFGDRPRVRIRRQISKGRVGVPKSRYGRRAIPLSPGMARRLSDLRAHSIFADDDAPVFASETGSPLDPANLRHRVLQPAARRAALGRVGFHTFRHSCASVLFEGGKNVKQVQEWLGHHDPGFTLRTYVHLLDEGLGEADFLDSLTAGPDTAARSEDVRSTPYVSASLSTARSR